MTGICLWVFGVSLFALAPIFPSSPKRGGSSLLPFALSVLIVLPGGVQILLAWKMVPKPTGTWPIRDTLPVLIGTFRFAITIRDFDFAAFEVPVLRMAVAAPLSIPCSSLAAIGARPAELLIFAAALSAICVGLFRYALGISLPSPLG